MFRIAMIRLSVKVQLALRQAQAQITERGATSVEYGLMVSMLVVAVLGAYNFFAKATGKSFNTSANEIADGALA